MDKCIKEWNRECNHKSEYESSCEKYSTCGTYQFQCDSLAVFTWDILRVLNSFFSFHKSSKSTPEVHLFFLRLGLSTAAWFRIQVWAGGAHPKSVPIFRHVLTSLWSVWTDFLPLVSIRAHFSDFPFQFTSARRAICADKIPFLTWAFAYRYGLDLGCTSSFVFHLLF